MSLVLSYLIQSVSFLDPPQRPTRSGHRNTPPPDVGHSESHPDLAVHSLSSLPISAPVGDTDVVVGTAAAATTRRCLVIAVLVVAVALTGAALSASMLFNFP